MVRTEPGNPLSSSNSAIWMSCQTWRLMLTILTITALLRLRQEDYRKWETSLGCGGGMEANGKSPGEDRLVFIVTGFGSSFPLELGCCAHAGAVSLLYTHHPLSRALWYLSVGHRWVCLFGSDLRVRLPVACYVETTGGCYLNTAESFHTLFLPAPFSSQLCVMAKIPVFCLLPTFSPLFFLRMS